MNPHYSAVAERAAHRCEYCRAPEVVFNFPFEVEHIIPPGSGGSDDESNWALACRACNLYKSNHQQSVDPDTQISVSLYHPRRDRWNEHFAMDKLAGFIVGRTPTGRATVSRLQMNATTQKVARQQWVRLGLYP